MENNLVNLLNSLLLEDARPKNTIWYHGTDEEFLDSLRPIYLSPSKAVSSMYGKKVFAFKINPNAKWFDLDKAEYHVPGIDSAGYTEGWAEKFVKKGYDIVWDKPDYKRGQLQIYVINPKVLEMVKPLEEEASLSEKCFSRKRWQKLAGILRENKNNILEAKNNFEEVQSDLFRGSGVNASTDFDQKIPEYTAYMEINGWGKMPPIHGVIQTVDEQDIEDYQEAEEGGYEHELDWSRPLTKEDIGMIYVNIEDGHNRAWAAREADIPIRVKIW